MYATPYQNKQSQNTYQNKSFSTFPKGHSASLHKWEKSLPLPLSLKEKKNVSNDIVNHRIPDVKIENHSLSRSSSVIQAKLHIVDKGITVSPFSQNMRDFYNSTIIPFLNQNNYRSYGILSQFRIYLNNELTFNTVDEFLTAFHYFLQGQTRTVRGGHTVPVLRKFSISTMSRPAWPNSIRAQLLATAQETDDSLHTRHVIRNRTLLTALQIYEATQGHEAMINLAYNLGAFPNNTIAYDACVRSLYRALYLNIANLWMGSGIVNQIIGFLATPIHEYGHKILQGEETFDATTLYNIMIQHTFKIKGCDDHKQAILCDLYNTIIQCLWHTEDTYDIGSLLEDIGLNLGFDMIDDRSDNILQRQGALLDTETRLQKYISSNGTLENLLDIFNTFLNI